MTQHKITTSSSGTAPTNCWCCGKTFSEDRLVRLGLHPEVGLCLQCTIWLKRRAITRHHEQHAISRQLLRAIDTIRNTVIQQNWHNHRWFGPLLRQINRYLP